MNLCKILSNYRPIRLLLINGQNLIHFNGISSQLSVNNTNNDNKLLMETKADKLYKTIEIESRCADSAVLKSYQMFVSMTAKELGITISRTWEPFRSIKRRTLLRAAFVKKKYRVQYEFRTYFRNMEFKHLTGSTADTFLEYIERNLPEGVALKVYKTEIQPLPQHISTPNVPLIDKQSIEQNIT